jgi:hypothetical protein
MDPDEFRNALLAGILLVVGAIAAETIVGGFPVLLAVAGLLVPVAYALYVFVLAPGAATASDSGRT